MKKNLVLVSGLWAAVFALVFSACPSENNTPSPSGGFTNVTDMDAYLQSQTGGTGETDPVAVEVRMDLTNNGWQELLKTLKEADKFVALDLSRSTMNGPAFNPDGTLTDGKDKIVSLVLPASATSIGGYTEIEGMEIYPFNGFTSLKTISGEKVTTIGNGAFSSCTRLTSISLGLPPLRLGIVCFTALPLLKPLP